LVVVNVQRGGPSTGLPTKTEQSDLNLTVFGGHGDAPRLVLAPADVEDCFYTTLDAFNLAERYQMPVILMSDYSLATRTQTIPRPDFAAVKPESRVIPGPAELKGYLRYRLTPNGVSPMALPGMPGGQYTATGLEHNEAGAPHMTPDTHRKMTEKRFLKVSEAAKEPGFTRRFGALDATVGVVCWGSTTGPVREAIGWALERKLPVAALQVRMLNPIPLEVRAFLDAMHTILVPEVNYQGQFAGLLRARFLKPVVQLNKYEGLPFSSKDILDKIVELCELPVPAGRTR
ncbi:MAG: 2-oxoacid:acceptor oxidoreductase subunit alpha, partial [bacterium]